MEYPAARRPTWLGPERTRRSRTHTLLSVLHRMEKRRWVPAFVGALVVALALAACGGPDDADDAVAPVGESDELATAEIEELGSESPSTVAPTTVAPSTTTSTATTTTTTGPLTGIEVNQALGKGINFGNSLEAPREGDWGAGLDEEYFAIIAEAGFEHVRLPVSWAAYADTEAPYTITDGVDPTIEGQPYSNIWERVDWAIDQAEANDLMIIVNMHHYDEAHVDPLGHRDRIIGMWQQIAPRYADAGDHVVFELFNEPNATFTDDPELWNDLLADLLAVVRETNPTRPVLIGPVGYNGIDFLDDMELPDDDYLIATVHLYEPFNFTHQGADWVEDSPPVGVPWSPDGFGLPEGIYDRSWDTRVITEDGQLRLDFGRQWAGFSVDFQDGVDPQEVRFEVAGNGSLRVGCRVPGSDELDEARVDTTAASQLFTLDLSGCPDEATGVSLMNSHPSSDPLRISSFEVCTEVTGCRNIITSADASLRRWVERASEWSAATGVPVHLGEFGAFSADGQVPMADRAAWTRTVVDEANEQGLSFAYWEFHAGYAAFDLDANAWNDPLLDALLG